MFSLSLVKVSLFAFLALPSALAAPVTTDRIASLQHASFGHPIALSGLPSGFLDLKQPRGLTTTQFIKKRFPESGSDLTPEIINNVSTPSPSTPAATVEQPEVEVPAPVQAESIPDVLSSLIAELKPVTEQLKTLVSGKTKDEVNVEEVTHSLQSIETLLKGGLERIKAILTLGGLNVKIPLTLGDKRITIFDLAKLVATLLDTLFGVLTLVIRVIGSLKIPIVSDLLSIVGDLVADLLTTVFGIIPGLKPVLGPLLEGVIGLLKIFDFASISKTIEI
ncbi:hypothetical protein BKA70DRAFT_539681 [Coprinopsis sp. MPI-PUGE-AT-0042]|nr:hypothetical protein BKA70DRAFT_539681 [Coprinopsis sp. MPI-PUGE-AT-0042]